MLLVITSRASSTKTRIETYSLWHKSCFHQWHQEQVPRKQGLKPKHHRLQASQMVIKSKFHENKDWNAIQSYPAHSHQTTSRASSTKTRIETNPSSSDRRTGRHQEQVPRKQGLKLSKVLKIFFFILTSRASSTKTRIETDLRSYLPQDYLASRASSTKTRIETFWH